MIRPNFQLPRWAQNDKNVIALCERVEMEVQAAKE